MTATAPEPRARHGSRFAAAASALAAILAAGGCRPAPPAQPAPAGPPFELIKWGSPEPISERLSAPQYRLPEGWKAAAADVVRIRVTSSGALRNDPATLANARRFQELTGIAVEILPWAEAVVAARTVAVLSARSDAVDVLCYDHAASYTRLISAGWLHPVDALWNDPNVWKIYSQGLQKGLTAPDGSIYGSVGRVRTQMLYYRPSVIAAPPTTWQEVRQAARRATGLWGFVFGAGGGDLLQTLAAMVYSQGGRVVDTQRQRLVVSSPQGRNAWQLLTEMVLVDRSAPALAAGMSAMEAADSFALGKAAMVLADTSEIGRFGDPETAPGIWNDWAASSAPKWSDGQPETSRASALWLDGYAVNRFIDDRQKAAAMLFLDFMRSHEASARELMDEGNEAAVLAVHDMPGPKKKPFPEVRRATMANAVLEPLPPGERELAALVGEYFAKAASGALDPGEALEELQSRLDDYAVPE